MTAWMSTAKPVRLTSIFTYLVEILSTYVSRISPNRLERYALHFVPALAGGSRSVLLEGAYALLVKLKPVEITNLSLPQRGLLRVSSEVVEILKDSCYNVEMPKSDPTYKRFMSLIEKAAQPSVSSSQRVVRESADDCTGRRIHPRRSEGTSSKHSDKSPSKRVSKVPKTPR